MADSTGIVPIKKEAIRFFLQLPLSLQIFYLAVVENLKETKQIARRFIRFRICQFLAVLSLADFLEFVNRLLWYFHNVWYIHPKETEVNETPLNPLFIQSHLSHLPLTCLHPKYLSRTPKTLVKDGSQP